MTKSLFERLGGHDAIKSVIEKFYVYMLSDAELAEHFKNTDMVKQKKRQADFIELITGGENHYEGKSMKQVHEHMKICKGKFDKSWVCFEKSLHDHKVSEDLIKEAKVAFYSVEKDVVTV